MQLLRGTYIEEADNTAEYYGVVVDARNNNNIWVQEISRGYGGFSGFNN